MHGVGGHCSLPQRRRKESAVPARRAASWCSSRRTSRYYRIYTRTAKPQQHQQQPCRREWRRNGPSRSRTSVRPSSRRCCATRTTSTASTAMPKVRAYRYCRWGCVHLHDPPLYVATSRCCLVALYAPAAALSREREEQQGVVFFFLSCMAGISAAVGVRFISLTLQSVASLSVSTDWQVFKCPREECRAIFLLCILQV